MADLQLDGPPVRLRDLVAITGLSSDTIYRDIKGGYLHAFKRRSGKSASYFVDRDVARQWLDRMGFKGAWPTQGSTVVAHPSASRVSSRI
jgi:predicted DNA-binding transcriptional regulator AlpA